MYSDKVNELFRNPVNYGKMEDYSAVGQVGNAKCGDILRIYLKIENDIITKATFETFGCAAAIASSSMATIMIIGRTLDQALQLKNSEILAKLGGLPNIKVHCSVLAEEAIAEAIKNYREQK